MLDLWSNDVFPIRKALRKKTIYNFVEKGWLLRKHILYQKKSYQIADSGVQFPVHLNKMVTPIGIIRLFSEKVNIL